MIYSELSTGNSAEITQDVLDALDGYQQKHSLKQLADQLGVSNGAISRWLKGNTKRINSESWNKVFNLLGDDINAIAEERMIRDKHQECQQLFSHFYTLLNKVYDPFEFNALLNNRNQIYEKAVQELQGMSFMISNSCELSNDEITLLAKWLEKNCYFRDKYPISELYELLWMAVAKNEFDTDWQNKVVTFLKSIATCQDVIGLKYDSADELDFSGANISITGAFQNGMTRREIEDLVANLGGIFYASGDVGPATEILIVGEKGAKAWRFGGYGRKIEYAIDLRKHSSRPRIIKESDFLAAIGDK